MCDSGSEAQNHKFSLAEGGGQLLQLLPLTRYCRSAAALQFGHFLQLLLVQTVGVLETSKEKKRAR